MTITQRILQHRLAQFALIGGAIFAIAPRAPSPRDIEIRRDRLEALFAAEAARAGTARLSPEKEREIEARAIEDELLYREALRLGLDRNDGIVRQRLVQKALFMAEELAGASRPPTEAEIAAFFAKNQERWTLPQRLHFTHVFAHRSEDLSGSGEPSPVPPEFEGSREVVAQRFGAGFAEAVAKLPVGAWSEPIASAFGVHKVRLIDITPARPARLDEVRSAVVEALSVHRRQEAVGAFLDKAFHQYRVNVDGDKLQDFTASRRMAFRSVSSGED